MKNTLNSIYQKYFPEIMTGILASLVVITGLLLYGIKKGSNDRGKIMQEQENIMQKQDYIYLMEAENLNSAIDQLNKTK